PDNVTVEYDDGTGAFTYAPAGATGDTDETVTAIRLRFEGPMRSPTNNFFSQSTALDFVTGIFDGTGIITEEDAVGATSRPSGDNPTYRTPLIPTAEEGSVVRYQRIVAQLRLEDEESITFSVLDANGMTIPGKGGLMPDGTGAIDISDLDPSTYPQIQVLADFLGGGGAGGGGYDDPAIDLLTQFELPAGLRVYGVAADTGDIIARGNGGAQAPGIGVWQKNPEGDFTYTQFAYPEGQTFAFAEPREVLPDGTVFAIAYDQNFQNPEIVVWNKTDATTWVPSVIEGLDDINYFQLSGYNYIRNSGPFGGVQLGSLGNQQRATVWVRDANEASGWRMVILPTLEGLTYSYAYTLNANGVAAGTCSVSGTTRTCVWEPDATEPTGYSVSTVTYPQGHTFSRDRYAYLDEANALLTATQNGQVYSPFASVSDGEGAWIATPVDTLGGTLSQGLQNNRQRGGSWTNSVVNPAGQQGTFVMPFVSTNGGTPPYRPVFIRSLSGNPTGFSLSTMTADTISVRDWSLGELVLWRVAGDGSTTSFIDPSNGGSYYNSANLRYSAPGGAFFGTTNASGTGVLAAVPDGDAYAWTEFVDEDNRFSGNANIPNRGASPAGAGYNRSTYTGYPYNTSVSRPYFADLANVDGNLTQPTELMQPPTYDSFVVGGQDDSGILFGVSKAFVDGNESRGNYSVGTGWVPAPGGYTPFTLPGLEEMYRDGNLTLAGVLSNGAAIGTTVDSETGNFQATTWVPAAGDQGFEALFVGIGGFKTTVAISKDRSQDWVAGYASDTPDGNRSENVAAWVPSEDAPFGIAGFAFVPENGADDVSVGGVGGVYGVGSTYVNGDYTDLPAVWAPTGNSPDGYEPITLPFPTVEGNPFIEDRPTQITPDGTVCGVVYLAGFYRAVLWDQTSPFNWDVAYVGTSAGDFEYCAHLKEGAALLTADRWSIAEKEGDTWTSHAFLGEGEGVASLRITKDMFDQHVFVGTYGYSETLYWTKDPEAGGDYTPTVLQGPGGGDDFTSVVDVVGEGYLIGNTQGGLIIIGEGEPRAVISKSGLLTLWRPDGSGGYDAFDITPDLGEDVFVDTYIGSYQEPHVAKDANGVFMVALRVSISGRKGSQIRLFAFVPDADAPAGYLETEIVTDNLTKDYSIRGAEWVAKHAGGCWIIPPGSQGGGGGESRGPNIGSASPQCSTTSSQLINMGPNANAFTTHLGYDYCGEIDVWGCSGNAKSRLDALSVQYQTDRNPSIGFQLEVADRCQQSITNTAQISTSTPEVTSSNNSSSATISVETVDVEVSIEADRGTLAEGEDVTYLVTVTNNGPGAADGMVVTLTSPPGLTDDGTFLIPVPPLGAGESWASTELGEEIGRSIDTSADVSNGTSLTVSVSVDHPGIDCVAGNNSASATVIVGSFPNIYVQMDGPTTVRVGDTFTYTVTTGNNGNAPATTVDVTASLPPGLTLVPPTQPTMWDYPTIERSDAPKVETITVRLDDCDAVGSSILSRVGATAQSDTNATDNAAAVTTQILPPEGVLSVALYPDRSTVALGDTVTYTAHFRNDGIAIVNGAVVTAEVPAGQTVLPQTISANGVLDTSSIAFSIGTLLPGQHGSVSYSVTIAGVAEGLFAPRVTTGGDGLCPSADTAAVVAITGPGLHIVKTADTAQACGDGTIGWSLTVTNDGLTTQDNLVVSDSLPQGVTYTEGSITGPGAQDQGAPVLLWNLGALAPGEGVTLSFATSKPVSAGALQTNTATVEQNGGLVATTAPAAIRVDCNGSLTLTKAWTAACALPGDAVDVSLTYTNGGTAVASNVMLADYLPSGFATVTVNDGGTYSPTSRMIRYQIGDLAPGASGTVGFTATMSTMAPGGSLVMNRASMWADNAAPQTSNGVASVVLACDDGNTCTQDACAPSIGCVYFAEPTTTACDDGDACTQADFCDGDSQCAGDEPVECEASDQCHDAGMCNSETGECSDPASMNGTECDDNSLCSNASSCLAGTCVADDTGDSCDDGNPCTEDSCDALIGCVNAPVEDGSGCSDNDLCTQADSCMAGACVGTDPVACTQLDLCHTIGECSPETGECSDPIAPEGSLCDDGSICTNGDVCSEGVCGGDAVVCDVADACQFDGVCNAATGQCDYDDRPGDSPVTIQLTDLGTLGGNTSNGAAINDSGMVAGSASLAGGQTHAFVWRAGDGMTDITPNAVTASVTGLTEFGMVVGVRETTADSFEAFVWEMGSGLTTLWLTSSGARIYVDEAGNIAGLNATGVLMYRAAGGTAAMVTLPTGATDAAVVDLDAGTLAGNYAADDGLQHAFVSVEGAAAEDLGPGYAADVDGGMVAGTHDSVAGALPNAWLRKGDGTIVSLDEGSVAVALDASLVAIVGIGPGTLTHGFYWTEAQGSMTDLGTLGGVGSSPVALNRNGEVTGTSDTAIGTLNAFHWSVSTGMVDLGTLGGNSMTPVAISGSGQIAGHGQGANGQTGAFLWSKDRGLEDLGQLLGAATVLDLNTNGQVVGTSTRAFVSDVPQTACIICETDNEPPTIFCPAFDTTVECTEGDGTIDLGDPTIRDNCGSGSVTVTSDERESYPVGTTPVTFTATDEDGNQASCMTFVTVIDTTAPNLACPADIVVDAADNICGSEVELTITATDACVEVSDVQVFSSAPDVFPIGETAVNIVAVDSAGNSVECETTVTVLDASPRMLTCDESLTVDAPADSCFYDEPITGTLTSQCDASIDVTVANEAYPVGLTNVLFESADIDGTELSCTTALTVQDVTPPSVRCGTPETVATESLPAAFTSSAADACGVQITVSGLGCTVIGPDGTTTELTGADCPALSEGETATVYGFAGLAGTVRWTVTAVDPSGNETVQTCEIGVNAAVLPVGPDLTGLIAAGGGGCSGGSTPTGGLLLLLAMLLWVWRPLRRRQGR
ncbi:MAG: putative repeat protein (TIGR01451 family), partial [Myxococcota bacterium]